MKFVHFTLAALAACVSYTVAADNTTTTFSPAPLGVIGHTAVVANNTVFIQGGQNKDTTFSKVSYAIILDKDHSLKNATWQDTSTISAFTQRDFGVAVAFNGSILTCGSQTGVHTDMMCDMFSTYTYNLTQTNFALNSAGGNRGDMAVAVSSSKAYFVGGVSSGALSSAAYVMSLAASSPTPTWKATGSLPSGLKYHTATWVDGTTNGVVVLGGLASVGIVALNFPQILSSTGNWTQTPPTIKIAGSNPNFAVYGHSAVNDGKGNIYIYGGLNAVGGSALNQHWLLNTSEASWTLQSLATGPEARAFHTATLLPDNTILYAFGQTGADQTTAVPTYFLYDVGANTWGSVLPFPTMSTTTRSPNIPPPPPPVLPSTNIAPSTTAGNNPNTPNSAGSGSSSGTGSSPSSTGLNVPLIAGIAAGAVVLLFLIILLVILCRRRNRRRPIRQYPMGPVVTKDMKDMTGPSYDDDEKAKNAKAFMIRRPPSVYMVDDQDPENEIPHPHYKSQYYGDHAPPSVSGRNSPSVAEYELMPPSGGYGRMSTVSSVAERRRFVEEQQRQFMDGSYENAHNNPPPFDSSNYNNSSKEERQSEYDDYHEEVLEELPSRRGTPERNASTGPRYPRTNRRGQPSQYEHPADDYFA